MPAQEQCGLLRPGKLTGGLCRPLETTRNVSTGSTRTTSQDDPVAHPVNQIHRKATFQNVGVRVLRLASAVQCREAATLSTVNSYVCSKRHGYGICERQVTSSTKTPRLSGRTSETSRLCGRTLVTKHQAFWGHDAFTICDPARMYSAVEVRHGSAVPASL